MPWFTNEEKSLIIPLYCLEETINNAFDREKSEVEKV